MNNVVIALIGLLLIVVACTRAIIGVATEVRKSAGIAGSSADKPHRNKTPMKDAAKLAAELAGDPTVEAEVLREIIGTLNAENAKLRAAALMTFDRFNQIWTALVADRPPSKGTEARLPLNNGVSEETVDALVAASSGDFKYFDDIDSQLEASAECPRTEAAWHAFNESASAIPFRNFARQLERELAAQRHARRNALFGEFGSVIDVPIGQKPEEYARLPFQPPEKR